MLTNSKSDVKKISIKGSFKELKLILPVLEFIGLGITLVSLFMFFKKQHSIKRQNLTRIISSALAKPLAEKKNQLINDLLNMFIQIKDIASIIISQNNHILYKREQTLANAPVNLVKEDIRYNKRYIGILRINYYQF